jgi:hypothetical protein
MLEAEIGHATFNLNGKSTALVRELPVARNASFKHSALDLNILYTDLFHGYINNQKTSSGMPGITQLEKNFYRIIST